MNKEIKIEELIEKLNNSLKNLESLLVTYNRYVFDHFAQIEIKKIIQISNDINEISSLIEIIPEIELYFTPEIVSMVAIFDGELNGKNRLKEMSLEMMKKFVDYLLFFKTFDMNDRDHQKCKEFESSFFKLISEVCRYKTRIKAWWETVPDSRKNKRITLFYKD